MGNVLSFMLLAGLLSVGQSFFHECKEQSVFVVGDIVVDLGAGLERTRSGIAPLVDCSTAKTFCALGRNVRIALPKRCENFRVGAEWRMNGIGMQVLGSVAIPLSPHRITPEIYFLGEPDHPSIVWEYAPQQGILGAFHDPLGERNFVEMARNGDLGDLWRKDFDDPVKVLYYEQTITFDPFWPCSSED